jgi:penicillin-binding protein 1C
MMSRPLAWLLAITTLVVAVVVVFDVDDAPTFAAVRDRWRPSEAYLLDRNGVEIDATRIDYGVRRFAWVPLDSLSSAFVDAVVRGEDRRFWTHDGVDWRAAVSALRDNASGRAYRGASTITMQLAALIDPRLASTHRSVWEKALQARRALQIERTWTKRQILEAYVNLLGFRGELQGIDAAARVLAGKVPSGLTSAESLVLAALLPAPRADAEHVADRACARAQSVAIDVDCDALASVARAMLARVAAPPASQNLAPELAESMLSVAGERLATTIDADVQAMARGVMERQLSGLSARNVRDGAALVVDNATGEVLAYVGSAGPRSSARQVDGVRARRQAGSTLKPFLYGLALERRYLTAASLLDDSPISLDTATGVYLPQNYDRDFKGPVSVRTALGSSLNVPAVRTLILVGVDAFRDRLYALGYSSITQDGSYYGYSLALGSAEVSLWEQVNAYRTLARGGVASTLTLRPDQRPSPSTRVLADDAAFVVTDVLSDRTARVATFGLDNNLNTPFWSAVKTGTSKDMRDNWCIGFTDRYTVGVWIGNFEGDSMRGVSGVTGAAPAWHDIVVALHERIASHAPTASAGVARVNVTFDPAVEPARDEWFLRGTELATVAMVPERAARTRIASPGNGLVVAIDPDIPANSQRVPFFARGDTQHLAFALDGARVGRADAQLLWQPTTGAHRLALVDTAGGVVDQVLFTVR